MRRAIITIGLAVTAFFICPAAMGENKTFETSGWILTGETWDFVTVKNNNTVVDMSGGLINNGLTLRDMSTFNMTGGEINGSINIIPIPPIQSTFNIFGGVIESQLIVNSGAVNISGGDLTIPWLKLYPYSTIEITGGSFDLPAILIMGELTIRGGFNLNFMGSPFVEGGTINIYGYGFNYEPHGGYLGYGMLTGYLSDGNSFSFDGLNEYDYSHFYLIPEPTTLLLFGIGGLFLKKQR